MRKDILRTKMEIEIEENTTGANDSFKSEPYISAIYKIKLFF